ncbi:retrovirus-related pol polyprotein from transposon TNT 1-94 [Tanacetum coccineum]|uniref:Retrovirus-related pol polyprotein from transposon TNT 1-94 n=1 Tax=Tanacetum coccineum TaxID=301880 RepID=A0ABQ4YBD4_9ASTR
MDPMISLGQKNTLAEYMILSGADNRPPMLDKDLYDSWKSRMELYMQNREHGRMILESVEHGPLIWPTVEENGVIRTKKYAELSAAEKIQADCDMKATNIILQGLPADIYSLEREFFTEWSKFVTDVKLVKDLHTSNFDQLHAYLEQHELHANEVVLCSERIQDPLDCFDVPVFSRGDDPIACLNKAMAFLTAVASSRFPTTNNQLRNSSNLKNHATIQDGRVTVQQVQGRQGQNYYAWYKDKAMLAEAQEAGQILDEEQLAFLADPGILADQAQTIIPHNVAFQTEDLDTYDSDCDDLSTAQAVLMANISNYGSDVISEDFEQSLVMDFTDNEISSDSNIIPYSQYLQETQQETVQDTNLQAQQDSMILSVIEQISREKMIDSQMDDMIREKLALKEQIDSLEQNLSKQIKENESLFKTFTVLKNESKEKENKYMENEIDLEKKIKERNNIVYKVGQSAQTVHMLTKPQAFYDNTHKQALGYQNPFYLRKAQRIKPTLYDGVVISKTHVAMLVIDDEETLILEEESRSKMFEKAKDPEVIAKKISHKPIDYEKLNSLIEDFETRFSPQQELSAEQTFWFHTFNPTIEPSYSPPVIVDVPSELPKVSLVNASLKKLKFHLTQFDSVVKKRTTPSALKEGEWGFEHTKAVFNNEIIPFLKSLKDIFNVFDKDLLNEITEVQTVFDQMEASVQQFSVDRNVVKLLRKKFFWKMIDSYKKSCMFKLDLVPLPPRLLQNREVDINYLRNTQEQANILRKIVKQAKAKQPLDRELELTCKYATRIQELLVYVQDTCPNAIKPSAKKVTVKPVNNVKKVRFAEPLTSSSKIQQGEVNPTHVYYNGSCTSKDTEDPSWSTSFKTRRTQKTSSALEDFICVVFVPDRNIIRCYKGESNVIKAQPRKVNKMNRVVKPVCDVDVKQSLSNANYDILYATCNKSMFDGVHDKCLLDLVQNGNNSAKSAKKHKKQNIWKHTGHVFTEVGFKWKPTGRTFTIVGNLCPLTRITSTNVVQIVLWYLDSGCSKHMTGNRSQLINFVSKFLGTVRFGNDQIAKIIGYGDYQLGNVIISRVYYVEGLGHNLFSVGQFCDADLEVAFRKNTCFIRNLEGVDLLSGSRDINLYTISLDDMLKSSPICLLSKASKTKSWLWHRRLSHLNFGTLNKLAKDGLARGIPRLKFQKDHLCSACALGKSKKTSHQPKAEDTNQEKLYLLHMDLCGPMRVASINGKSSGPGLHYMTPVTSSTGLGSNPVSQLPCFPPKKYDWDHLFQPMFDEYFNPPPIAVSPVQEAAAPRAEVLADSPVSTSID